MFQNLSVLSKPLFLTIAVHYYQFWIFKIIFETKYNNRFLVIGLFLKISEEQATG